MVLSHLTYTGVAELLNELDKLAEMFIGDINATAHKETDSNGNFTKHGKD
jgi:3-phosphoglycerate kinase